MCVASVASAIERSALLVDVFTFDQAKMTQEQDVKDVTRRTLHDTLLQDVKTHPKTRNWDENGCLAGETTFRDVTRGSET